MNMRGSSIDFSTHSERRIFSFTASIFLFYGRPCRRGNPFGRTRERLPVESAVECSAGAPARDRRECATGALWLSSPDHRKPERRLATPFAAVIAAVRTAAPTNLVRTGAFAGLVWAASAPSLMLFIAPTTRCFCRNLARWHDCALHRSRRDLGPQVMRS